MLVEEEEEVRMVSGLEWNQEQVRRVRGTGKERERGLGIIIWGARLGGGVSQRFSRGIEW